MAPAAEVEAIDLAGLPNGEVLVRESKSRVMFDLTRSLAVLLAKVPRPPAPGERYTMLSDAGGWSSCSLIMWIAHREPILDLFASTFRVGAKEIAELDMLHSRGRLFRASFVLMGLAQMDGALLGAKYDYYSVFRDVCDQNGWEYRALKNHSKVILMRTAGSWYVCETSSNLNANPKIEQFSLENDPVLYEFYLRNLFKRGDA